MKDFIDEAHDAASGPPSTKSKPATSDGSRAKDVAKNTSLGSMKGGIKGVSSSRAAESVPQGSSAGLRNETSATVTTNDRGYSSLSKRSGKDFNVTKTSPMPRNPVGSNKKQTARVVDHTLKGQSAKSNSIGCLEKRMNRNRKF